MQIFTRSNACVVWVHFNRNLLWIKMCNLELDREILYIRGFNIRYRSLTTFYNPRLNGWPETDTTWFEGEKNIIVYSRSRHKRIQSFHVMKKINISTLVRPFTSHNRLHHLVFDWLLWRDISIYVQVTNYYNNACEQTPIVGSHLNGPTWKVTKLENLATFAVSLLIFLAGTGLSVCYWVLFCIPLGSSTYHAYLRIRSFKIATDLRRGLQL